VTTSRDPLVQKQEIADFYDSFAEKQIRTGLNLRHYTIFRELRRAGLKKHHTVLEVGCGIGTLTTLVHAYLGKGRIVATDISGESIRIAEARFRGSGKVRFLVTDMKEFTGSETFDFIILPDVLEHIPVEQHRNLFRVLRSVMHKDSVLLINIPHPRIIEYYRKHEPHLLQIIDQPIYSDALLNDVYANELVLESYKSYTLFHQVPDASLVILKVKQECTSAPRLSKAGIILKKLRYRLFYWISRI
jgi:trans-aconitate 2-methyltransferase